jgi:hypothetical protein
MKFVYTLHAEEQIRRRKIEKVWIEETIRSPDSLRRENHKCYAKKKLNGASLKVVFIKEKYIKVVTAYFIK